MRVAQVEYRPDQCLNYCVRAHPSHYNENDGFGPSSDWVLAADTDLGEPETPAQRLDPAYCAFLDALVEAVVAAVLADVARSRTNQEPQS